MKIAVGTTGSKHLAASHSTDIFVGLGFELAAQAQRHGAPAARLPQRR
jgi:hypothetical protein